MEVVPWLDQPKPNPVPEVIVQQLDWEQLDSWITPPDRLFVIKHFDQPELNERDWHLEVGGLVAQPMADLATKWLTPVGNRGGRLSRLFPTAVRGQPLALS